MTRIKKLARRGRDAARRVYKKGETKVLAAVGRQAVKQQARSARLIGKKAVKTGLIVGALAAAEVVVRAVTNRRSES